jgi:hypothetical protein
MMARWLPATLLGVVAIAQIILAFADGLTPWKGGGFGMFSTLDHGAWRRVEVVVDAPNRSEGLEIPPSLEAIAARSAAYPADWLLRELAEGIAARERRHNRPVTRVTLSVWRTEFDPVHLTATEHPLRSFVYDVK